jgi:autophagy-related protein 9
LAKWKFREFNELPHLFEKRINMSYPFASRYVEQFPKIKMVHVFRFVSFVAGAIVSVLALASVLDPDLFLGFEITSERTVIFYLGVFGTIWAVAHGAIPEENMVFDPEYALRNVIEYTHYMPSQWKDRLHSDEVKREFSELYQMKIVIFLEEVISIIFTPFVLWLSLPQCSDRIIDFFREFTIHVDGLGYVCSFAVFDFKKGIGNTLQQGSGNTGEGLRDDYYSTKHGKMAASYYGFIDNYVTNPKTGIPGHVPPGIRPQFHPPPAFPGLMSPTLAADMAVSRMGRSERPRSHAPAGASLTTTRTPRFPQSAAHASPLPSMLLDPHHQPSTSGFGGGRSVHNRRNSRSRYLPSRNIIEDPIEDEEEEEAAVADRRAAGDLSGPEISGLDESRWETSPTRTTPKMTEEEESASGNAGGVLGLLYQFHQKAQSDGRAPGVHI